MRILYVAMKYDYGDPNRGYSFEHYNFFDFFQQSGHDVTYFDFMDLGRSMGKTAMNRRLLDIARSEKPELMFSVMFTDELEMDVVRQISALPEVTTLNWFCDDHWRFDNYSRLWAPHFNWVVTTANSAIPKYEGLQFRNVIKSQWGCNHGLYRKSALPYEYDVTFVGQPHGNRRAMVKTLSEGGIDVRCFGFGWDEGRVSQERMIQVFNQSRINLNFSNASVQSGNVIERWTRGLAASFLGAKSKRQFSEQIKGRNFEVPGCGGFLLTSRADDLESYYELDKEIVCFDGLDDLIEKIQYYLAHDDERAAIARRGYERTQRDHTYGRRFEEIFWKIGLVNA
jgi:spore maturation protein CgeB